MRLGDNSIVTLQQAAVSTLQDYESRECAKDGFEPYKNEFAYLLSVGVCAKGRTLKVTIYGMPPGDAPALVTLMHTRMTEAVAVIHAFRMQLENVPTYAEIPVTVGTEPGGPRSPTPLVVIHTEDYVTGNYGLDNFTVGYSACPVCKERMYP